MTFFLGVLSLFMMVVFPGAIALKCMKANQKLDPWLFLVCVFALSLVMNLVLVIGLTTIHQYRTGVLRNLAALECLAFILMYQQWLDQKVNWQGGLKWLLTYPYRQKPLQSIALLLTFLALINWLGSFGNPFGYWDATVSYNRWATDFAANHMPTLTWHYPQLLPANWSMTYVLIGALPGQVQLEFFPACIQGFFFIGILLLFWVLYRQEKEVRYLPGLILTALIFGTFYQIYLNVGYADIPVTFFNLAALVCSLLAYGAYSRYRKLLVALALLFAFGAAMTKPAGIYIALILPILHECFEGQKTTGLARAWRLLWKYLLLVLLVAPWYIYSSLYGSETGAFSDVSFLVHDVISPSYISRLYEILSASYLPLVLGAIVWVFRSWVPRKLTVIFYCYIPYLVIWICWFSYDDRNIELFLPILALNAGFIFNHNWRNIFSGIKSWRLCTFSIRLWMILSAALVVTGFFCFVGVLGEGALIVHQETEKNFSLNARPFIMRLYAYTLCPGIQGQILTDYAYFNYLPLLKNYMNIPPLASYNKNMEPGYFEDLPAFLKYMKANPNIHYLMLNHNYDSLYESPLWHQYYTKWLMEKKISMEFFSENVGLYKINVSNDQLADVSGS